MDDRLKCDWRRPASKARSVPGVTGTVVRILLLAGLAAYMWFRLHRLVPTVILSVVATILICSLFLAPLGCWLKDFERLLTKVIGTLVTYLCLVPMFFFCFIPGRMILMLTGKDPMKRRGGDNSTYWIEKTTQHTENRYERMF